MTAKATKYLSRDGVDYYEIKRGDDFYRYTETEAGEQSFAAYRFHTRYAGREWSWYRIPPSNRKLRATILDAVNAAKAHALALKE